MQEIVELEDKLTQASRALDVDALDRIYADDIIMTSVLGEPCGKAVVLDEARRGVAQRESAASAGKPITSSCDKEDLKVVPLLRRHGRPVPQLPRAVREAWRAGGNCGSRSCARH